MKQFLKQAFALSALAAALASPAAFAATATTSLQVTATVNASCVISATNVAFGGITPAATGTAASTGTVTATCSNGTAYTVGVNGGTSGDSAARSMAGTAGNTDKLAYNLYVDNAHTQVLNETGAGLLTGTGSGVAQTQTFYAQLNLNQYIKSDSYTDNLTVTLTY